jgi:hypothetical protein
VIGIYAGRIRVAADLPKSTGQVRVGRQSEDCWRSAYISSKRFIVDEFIE